MQDVFQNARLNETFDQQGFVIIRGVFRPSEVRELREYNDRLTKPKNLGQMWSTLFVANAHERNELRRKLDEIVAPRLQSYLAFENKCVGVFINKGIGAGTASFGHQDWSLSDEETNLMANAWIPLVDVDTQNGCLYVVPGSHREFRYPRPALVPWAYDSYQPILQHYVVHYPLRAGDLVVYNLATIHGSNINQTKTPRPAILFGVQPASTLQFHHYDTATNTVEVYEVSGDFMYTHEMGKRPAGVPLLRTFKYEPPIYSAETYEQALRALYA